MLGFRIKKFSFSVGRTQFVKSPCSGATDSMSSLYINIFFYSDCLDFNREIN